MDVKFECYPAKLDEKTFGDRAKSTPEDLVSLLGRAKAACLRDGPLANKKGVLLTGDQVVVMNGQIYEKPETVDEAFQFMSTYSNHVCSTVGSVVVTDLESGRQEQALERCDIYFKEIPREDMEAAINNGNSDIMWCAGALMIEHPNITPHIVRMEGSDESIRGFGTSTVAELVRKLYSIKEE